MCNVTSYRSNHNRLKEYLKNKPLIMDPPIYEVGTRLSISLLFGLVAILDIDEVKQVYTFIAYFEASWKDPEVSWNATEFGNISEIQLDRNSVWTPTLFIGNGVDRLRVFDGLFDYRVESPGYIIVSTTDIFKVTCSINAYRYPFDSQTCGLRIVIPFQEPWDFHAMSLDLPLQELFATDNEWYLHGKSGVEARVWNSSGNARVTGPYTFQVADFMMTLKRKYVFYIVTTIFPLFLLSILASFVFLLPASSGDKMSYLISIFVSHTVFLNYVNESMPRTSNSLSLFELYLSFVLSHCCLAILATLLVLRAYTNWQHHDQSGNRVSSLSELTNILKPELFKVHNSSLMKPSVKKGNTSKGPRRTRCYMTLGAIFFVLFLTSAVVFPVILVVYL
ncbi:neuronal acetylcholine receptor subunit alpha-7-like [Gigantopelta aegis]|uniref:neuronal acetylcholine receptor subunit alpha-7-like n=1 Tax=Gigantopelta aegis TaxID=1735272 RepID=UPI001B88E720|nr:neuronal acetylcholine receptor subunit alpha-7-like [Gigantopelta aegis]